MENYSKAEILRMVEDEDVEFIRLQFTDMHGVLKNVAVPSSRLLKAMENKCVINLTSLSGFDQAEDTEMYLKPDLSTFTILPWRPQQGKVARFLCDVCLEDGTEYEASSRMILKRVIEKAEKMGYTFQVNPECEFFLFHTDDNGMPTTISHEKAGYLDTSPIDLGENTRRDIILTLEEMGYEIDSSHHESAPAQHEIDFTFENALETADKIMTFKVAVRTIAKRYGLHATFMPKPRMEVNGSGMHLNMRLLKDGKNIFRDKDGNFSREGEAFMAGILQHIQGMTAIFNPLVNSYKRLVPGFEAPSEVTWSTDQREVLIRVRERACCGMHMELRSPDSSSNPYLVFALCLAAGLEGIEKNLKAPAELREDIRKLTGEEKREKGIEALPENLGEALKAMEQDFLIRETLGEKFTKSYLKAKRKEWKGYLAQISEWELNQYLYLI
ncbi:MAG: type I glutamate--ammonia ligase [Oliverpabstia sp.]|nr:type I glutamate--ammonia ligase [Oliverpabstia sp.]